MYIFLVFMALQLSALEEPEGYRVDGFLRSQVQVDGQDTISEVAMSGRAHANSMDTYLENVMIDMVSRILIVNCPLSLNIANKLLYEGKTFLGSAGFCQYMSVITRDLDWGPAIDDLEKCRIKGAFNAALYEGDKRSAEALRCILNNEEWEPSLFSAATRESGEEMMSRVREAAKLKSLKVMAARVRKNATI